MGRKKKTAPVDALATAEKAPETPEATAAPEPAVSEVTTTAGVREAVAELGEASLPPPADGRFHSTAEPPPVEATVTVVLAEPARATYPRAQKFVVPFGGTFGANGEIQTLAPGSVVSDATHDMRAILDARIQLQPAEG